MRKLTDILKDLIFPRRCIFCNNLTQYPNFICRDCIENFPFKDEKLCERCGKKEGNCICCSLSSSITKIVSASAYEGTLIKYIKRFKGDRESVLGDNFADLLENVLSSHEELGFYPYITYVPMEKEKEEARGHNMAKTLAQKLSDRTGRILIDPPVEKIYTPSFQHELGRKERFKNAGISFLDKKEKVQGNIILIDDVVTTGATVNRVADILIKNGADRVSALCIASTQKRERQ